MAGLTWYKRDPVAFLNGTVGLGLEEKGAYSIILDLIYAHGGPIRDDARWVAGNCGCSVRRWNVIRDRLVALGKIQCEAGFISNSRAVLELESTRKNRVQERSPPDKTGENEPVSPENKDLPSDTRTRAPASRVEKMREEKRLPLGQSVGVQGETPAVPPAEPVPKAVPKPRKPKTVRTRLDPSWSPSEGNRAYAKLTGLTDAQIDAIAVRYVRYWTGADAKQPLKADWDRTWENWIDREIADGALNRGNGGGRSSGNNGRGPGWVAGMLEVRARRGDPDNLSGVGPAHGVPPVFVETPPAPARKRPGPLAGPDPGETIVEADDGIGGGNPPDEAEGDDALPF